MLCVAMLVRPSTESDEPAVRDFLRHRHSDVVARLGRLERPLEHPALLVEERGELAGVLTYVLKADACEILTLHAAQRGRGAGTALIAAVERLALDHGCRRLWVLTTNDNLDALRFYQRRGFCLTELHPGAVAAARASLKPELPPAGDHDIPIRDELVLEKRLRTQTARAPAGYGAPMSVDLFAGVPVSDYETARPWYERLLGAEPAFTPHATEAVWELAEHRFLYIVEDAERAGRAIHTIMLEDLDTRVADIAARGIEPDERVTYPGKARKAIYRDADGNEISFGDASG
jgi:N-acetylglutamate synthase-like GNAT family acetyltransferase